jgi:serine/threonine protein kinase/tetratricopeptide (TPR) repeat protein
MAESFPRRFGKYVLLKALARGGMGEIYLAAGGELGFQKFCVVKKVIAEKTDRVKANRFLDEAKVVLRLTHANLVPTFDAGEVDGEFFIAMELVEGKDLREIWNRCVRTKTRIPLDVALHVGREIARALAYVHTHGDLKLVHRDVAPPNILVSYFGEVKLTDFGLARSVLQQENTAPGVVFGRASYLSPEQARGEIADARTDIYSLGIVLWELVTGNQYLQLANLDPATAMSLVRHPRAHPPSSKAPWITASLDALLMKALAPAREDRFQSAEEMRKALSDVITQISPRADAERAAEFLRQLYGSSIKEERGERDRLLAESANLLAGRQTARDRPTRATPAHPDPDGERVAVSRMPVPLAALDEGSTKLHFPREEDSSSVYSSSVDFTGRVIDSRYRVLRKIGEGGMGTVYEGEHVEIGKGVAIKILHPAYSTQQDLVERFRREARAASRIGHPNIIDVTDFGSTEDGCAYFVMEHLDGIDLADVLSHERRIAPARAAEIAAQICRALAAAHAAGVIHRDLKPENVFLVARDGKADFVKVLDFGIARSMGRASRLTNPGVAMGTPEYMAPEQSEGGPVDRRSDIYSVGALLYEMVTGSPPQRTRDKSLIPPRGIKADVPDELERIVVHALEPDPEQRYQTMPELEYDLVKWLYGRARAVSDLLGLREPERGVVPIAETALASDDGAAAIRDRRSPMETPSQAAFPRDVASSPASPRRPRKTGRQEPIAPAPPSRHPSGVAQALAPAVASGPESVRRFLAAFAALIIVAALAVPIYRRLPWTARRASGSGRPAVAAMSVPAFDDLRAQSVRAGTAAADRMLTDHFGFAQLGAFERRLAQIRGSGGGAAADALAERASTALQKIADDELDAGSTDAGVVHYERALRVSPRLAGAARLADALRTRGEAALADGKSDEAVRWAREMVAVSPRDPIAHALLADSLHTAHHDSEAVHEYEVAIALKPDDPALGRGLARARRNREAPRAPAVRATVAAHVRKQTPVDIIDPAATAAADSAAGTLESSAKPAPPASEGAPPTADAAAVAGTTRHPDRSATERSESEKPANDMAAFERPANDGGSISPTQTQALPGREPKKPAPAEREKPDPSAPSEPATDQQH